MSILKLLSRNKNIELSIEEQTEIFTRINNMTKKYNELCDKHIKSLQELKGLYMDHTALQKKHLQLQDSYMQLQNDHLAQGVQLIGLIK